MMVAVENESISKLCGKLVKSKHDGFTWHFDRIASKADLLTKGGMRQRSNASAFRAFSPSGMFTI
jgi:hypothetical protein